MQLIYAATSEVWNQNEIWRQQSENHTRGLCQVSVHTSSICDMVGKKCKCPQVNAEKYITIRGRPCLNIIYNDWFAFKMVNNALSFKQWNQH